MRIFVAYGNGKQFFDDELNGKKFPKKDIIGVAVSTGDYEMVWGNEWYKGKQSPLQTWSEDGESGLTNSYSGYKSTEMWKVRVKRTYELKNGRYREVRKTIRESTHVPTKSYLANGYLG